MPRKAGLYARVRRSPRMCVENFTYRSAETQVSVGNDRSAYAGHTPALALGALRQLFAVNGFTNRSQGNGPVYVVVHVRIHQHRRDHVVARTRFVIDQIIDSVGIEKPSLPL
jgi:hypothetical protein